MNKQKQILIFLLPTTSIVLLIFFFPHLSTHLQYDRTALAQGEWWRLFTAHFTHWTGNHLLWDLIMFLVLATAGFIISAKRTLSVIFISALFIPLAILVWNPEMIYYRGLSGLDSALYLFMLLELIKRQPAKTSSTALSLWIMIFIFVAKTIYEFTTSNTLFAQSMGANISSVPLAHLVGGLVGVCAILLFGRMKNSQAISM